MLEKIKNILAGGSTSLSRVKIKGWPRRLLAFFMVLIFTCILLYISGWLYIWITTGRPDLSALNVFIGTISGTTLVGSLIVIIKALIDDDADGVPDAWQQGGGIQDGRPTPGSTAPLPRPTLPEEPGPKYTKPEADPESKE